MRLDDESDELLDLGWRKALGLRHDRDGRLVEVRKDIDRQAAQRKAAPEHQDHRDREDEQAIAQRLRDEEGEHRPHLT